VQSLRYCATAVREAWQRSSKMEQAGRREEMPPLDLGARLRVLAAAVPEELGGAAELRRSIEALAATETGAEQVEAALARLDRELMTAAEESLTDGQRQEVERGVERGLEALGGRLTSEEGEVTRRRLREQTLRRRLRLPLLSLFAEL